MVPRGRKKALMIGSTAGHIIGHAPQSAIVVHPKCTFPKGRPGRFLVAVDNNQASVKALLDALALSADYDEITISHVVTDPIYPPNKAKMLRSKYEYLIKGSVFRERIANRRIHFSFLQRPDYDTSVAEVVTSYAERQRLDMICIGSVNARSGQLNSVASEVVLISPCAVCVSHFKNVRHADYIEKRRMEMRTNDEQMKQVVSATGDASP
mmetsp:Transcript_119110/g.273162  ORF Transcript_119110/g.273162 Transcript_119110/m.273162 type:complete len:210 (+) Transcript_119110:1175-1804(+)